jgi:glycosyltransferase involved in cell wall biosynthesis
MKPLVSFIIPVRNDALRLEQCLQSIKAGRYDPARLELVVADNGSTDDSVVRARAQGARVLELPGLRLGELRNRAVAVARGEILAFVDADHEIGAEWIPAAVGVLGDPDVAAVGAACSPPSPATPIQRLYDSLRLHAQRQQEVEWLGSGNMAVRRSAFDAVGGFDASLDTCEDVDLCRKLRASGHRLLADARLYNVHYGDPRTLRHVFFGELWRGRDNVRVSLRPPRTWRTIASAAIPVSNFLFVVIALIGLVSASRVGLAVAALGALSVFTLVGLRTWRMLVGGAPAREFLRAFAVAAAYESGRTLALTAWFSHHHRRKGATA